MSEEDLVDRKDIVEMRTCTSCSTEFPFTVGDEKFYKEKGWDTRPNRCKPCRQKRKAYEKNQL